jgi:hypothetical protein
VRLVNLTTHDVTVIDEDGDVILNIRPSGDVARTTKLREKIFQIYVDHAIVPVNETSLSSVHNLPPMRDNTFYIVSHRTYEAAGRRADLLVVDESVRDSDGKTIGCRALARPV